MTPPQSGPGSLPRGAEDIWALMQRLQPFEGRFSPSDSASQAAGEQCVAAGLRHLARIEHRPQCRRLVIRVVGMPAIADIALLLRLLAHLGDRRIAGYRGEEAVDVDLAKTARERDVLLRA